MYCFQQWDFKQVILINLLQMKKSLFVFIGLLLCACYSVAQLVKPVPVGFVYPDGNLFKVKDGNGVVTPFYFSGTNNYYLMYKPTSMVDDLLDAMVALDMKVVRMWFFMDGPGRDGVPYLQTAAGVYNEVAYVAIDKVVAAASARGLRIIPVFVNYWSDFGGMQQYATWAGSSATDFYTNTSMKQTYKNYVASWINRTNTVTGVKYKEDPTIFSWQLTNEARGQNGESANVVNWAKEMSDYIRTLDSHHMICMGDEGILNYTYDYCDQKGLYKNFCYSGGQGDWVELLKLSNIDFGTFHSYWVDQWAPYDRTSKLVENTAEGVKWIDIHVDEANKIGKPCILEEYNKADEGSWSTTNDQNRAYVMGEYQKAIRGEGFSPYLNANRSLVVAGDLSWMLTGLNYVDPVEAGYTLSITPPIDVAKLWLYRVKWGSDGHSYSMYDPLASATIKAHTAAMNGKNVIALPAHFTQTSPSPSATGVSISGFLTWGISSNATSYDVVVADNAGFATPIQSESGLKVNTLKLSGLTYNKVYYWKVTAKNILGEQIATNAGISFTTQAPPPAVGGFSLISPSSSNTTIQGTLFKWNSASSADYYNLVVSRNSDLSLPIINVSEVNGLQYQSSVTLDEATTYYWQVTGVNTLSSKVSSVGSFTTVLASPIIDFFESYSNCTDAAASWVRNSGGAMLDVCSESTIGVSEGTKSMKLHYSFNNGGYCGVIKNLGSRNFTGYSGIVFNLSGDGSNNHLTVQIKEASGEYWELSRPVGNGIKDLVTYDFSSFQVTSWSQKNGVLDLNSIAEVALYFGGDGGTSDVYVDKMMLLDPLATNLIEKKGESAKEALQIYPNPAKFNVTIRVPSSAEELVRVEIYSVAGVELFASDLKTSSIGEIYLNVNSMGLNEGVYVVNVEGVTARLIVKLSVLR